METAMIELYHLGREAFDEGRYDDAQRFFVKLEGVGCRFADVFNMLGAISFSKGDHAAARKRFQEALDINPRYTEACLNLAVTMNELGDYGSGEAAFNRARTASLVEQGTLDPYVKGRLANLHADIGEIYHGLGLHEEAVTEYLKALSLGPSFPDLRTRLGVLYRDMGEHDKAVQEFTRVKRDHPAYSTASIQLGISYYSRGQVELAVDEWNSILSKDPGNPKALMYLKLAEKDNF